MENRIFAQRGFLRLSEIIRPKGPLPIGRSTWFAGVRSGRYPKGHKLGPGITAWKAEEIEARLDQEITSAAGHK